MESVDRWVLLLCLSPILLCCIAETAILGYAYFNADKVDCTWLWCTFTTERRSVESNTIETHTYISNTQSICYLNNVSVNCSEVNKVW